MAVLQMPRAGMRLTRVSRIPKKVAAQLRRMTRRLSWTARHGMVLAPEELMDNKSDFWEFLIPGVGLTPVVQFQILISLFVIGIGPVNYLLLRRWRRLGLLLITVPASAAIVTLALFGYALIHDGLGVRVRARS